MKVRISYKHMEHSVALDAKIHEKSERIIKYLHGDHHVDWVCWVEDSAHWAEVKVHSDHGDYFAKAATDSMYKTLDKIMQKLERQIDKDKDQRNKIHTKSGLKRIETQEEVGEETT